MGKPHSIASVQRMAPSDNERFAALGPIAARFGRFPKGTVLPETTVLECPRVKIADLPKGHIPQKYFEKNLEQNQQAPLCCRHVEGHYIEAWKSLPDEEAPDIYIIICGDGGRKHRRFLMGAVDDVPRPLWKCD
jgi:hypothetical protein